MGIIAGDYVELAPGVRLNYNRGTGAVSLVNGTTIVWSVSSAGVFTSASSLVVGSTTISEAEIGAIDGVTLGTIAASKAASVDANKDSGVYRTLSAKTFAGLDANTQALDGLPAPSALISTAGNATYLSADILKGIVKRDPNGAGRTDVLPTAALLVAAIAGCQVRDVVRCLFINCADAAETITMSAGAGGAFDTDQIAATRIIPQNTSREVVIRLTNVTPSSEAYVVYM